MFKSVLSSLKNIWNRKEKNNYGNPPSSLNFSKNINSGTWSWDIIKDVFSGEKFPGSIGIEKDFANINYWKLRSLSYRFFTENKYASGLIKRLLTNVIHKGLTLEATVQGKILGLTDKEINEINEDIETKFDIFAEQPNLISYNENLNFGQLQAEIYKTSLLSGDCLIVLRQDSTTHLPTIDIIDGVNIRTPPQLSGKKEIKNGIELDKQGKHVAFYVKDLNKKEGYTRIPARGNQTGRLISWMVYGDKIRIDDVRGIPFLAIILYSVKELDRYADSEQRAAFLNSVIPLFMKKTENKPGSGSFSAGAVRQRDIKVETNTGTKSLHINKMIPGLVMEDLQQGEEPVSFSTVRPNVNYRIYEEVMMASFAWCKEMPPSIYRLIFSSNYSASGAEINEFKLFLNKERGNFASQTTKKYYPEWLISMVMLDLIEAPGLLESYQDKSKFLIWGAWFSNSWAGIVKPSLRLKEEINAYKIAIAEGFTTRSIAAKKLFGERYSTVIGRQIKENELLATAQKPLQTLGLIEDKNKKERS